MEYKQFVSDNKEIKRLREENAAMKESLKWFADLTNYSWSYPDSNVMVDRGGRARATLANLSEGRATL